MMWRFSLYLLVATGTAALPLGAATAQLKPEIPTGSHMQRKPTEADPAETRLIIGDFAKCAIKKHRREAVQFVLSGSSRETMVKIADPDCLSKTIDKKGGADVALRLPPNILGYALADALINEEFPTFDAAVISTASAPTDVVDSEAFARKPGKRYTSEELKKLEDARAAALKDLAFMEFGECVVRTNPSGAYALIRANATSPGESAAFQGLMQTLGGCLGKGEQFQANRTMLRGIIALNFYRLAHAPRLQSSSGAPK